jgi:hypothetical protein
MDPGWRPRRLSRKQALTVLITDRRLPLGPPTAMANEISAASRGPQWVVVLVCLPPAQPDSDFWRHRRMAHFSSLGG